MTSKIIGIRELHRNLKQVSAAVKRGRSFVVVKNTTPVFRIEPLERKTEKKYTLADLAKLRFRGGSRNLSKEIDMVLYGT